MLIKMKVEISGTHNGQPYPRPGVATEVEDRFGMQLCQKGLAVPVDGRRSETATLPEAETRRGGLTRAKAGAAARTGAEES